MMYILIFAIVGELATLMLLMPAYGFVFAFLAAPIGGALLALIAGIYLNITGRHRRPTNQRRVRHPSASNTPAA